MPPVVISVEHLSKSYRLGVIGTGTFYGDLKRWWAIKTNKPDPYLKVDETDHRQREGEIIWALKDINFDVQQGDAMGIIGRNGAGKSTILKILSRVTAPTEGYIKVKGRIASLLEVGTGFHPDLTGRENVYLNGAILGMTRVEVRRKFDEIVDFSEIEKFIDTPVKRYSSGMYVRLAFSVAAHLEPDILILDEVLAVGDANFQKKCLNKMEKVNKEGRTVLFVSHSMAAISQFCKTCIVLNHGVAEFAGDTHQATHLYLKENKPVSEGPYYGPLVGSIYFNDIYINDQLVSDNMIVSPLVDIKISVKGGCIRKIPDFRATFSIYKDGVCLFSLHDTDIPTAMEPGDFESEVKIPAYFLMPGDYSIGIGGNRVGTDEWIWGMDLANFEAAKKKDANFDVTTRGVVNIKDYPRGRKQKTE